MNLERAVKRTTLVRGPKSAARLYNDIEYELALGEPDDHLEVVGEEALELLEERLPGVRAAAREIKEPPSLSHRAIRALDPVARPSRRPWLPARRRPGHAVQPSGRLLAFGIDHPLLAIGTIALSIVVIVHFLTYVVLGALAVVTINFRRSR
jgi:hypothetical protein